MTAADAHLETGAMALDCLPPDEAGDFLEHQHDCPSCALELLGFRETAAMLGGAVAAPAPASLRRSVLEAIAVTPQLPPLVGNMPASLPTARHRAPEPTPGPGPATVVPLRRPWYRRPQQLLLAAAVAVLLVGGGTAIVLSTTSPASQTASSQSCTQTASDVQTFRPDAGAAGAVAYAASCHTARVAPAGLPVLDASKVYQLWMLDAKGNARSVGVLKTSSNGSIDPTDATVEPGDVMTAISVETAPGPAATPSKNIPWTAKI